MMGQQCVVTGTSSAAAAAAAGREREQRKEQRKPDKGESREEGKQGVCSAQVACMFSIMFPHPPHP